MFIYSDVQDFQGNEAVKEVFVFSSYEAQKLFEEKYKEGVAKVGLENVSSDNIGAAFKLKAVKESSGKFRGIIRCGITGMLLYESSDLHSNYLNAISDTKNHLKYRISTD